MTIIAAVKDNGRVFIGSDTLCQSGDTDLFIEDGKWAVGPHWAIGLSGHLRYIFLAREIVAGLGPNLTIMQVARALRDAVREDGAHSYEEKGEPQGHDLSGLITNGVDLWNLDCSYAPLPAQRYAARGMGREFAHGAMWTADGTRDAQALLRTGLQCAIENCRGCGGNMWIAIQAPAVAALRPVA